MLAADLDFPDKDAARAFFQALTQVIKDWNRVELDSDDFAAVEARLDERIAEARDA